MQALPDNYFAAYRSLKSTRDAEGVLVVQFHTDGGPCTFSALHHTEVVDAFHQTETSLLGLIGHPSATWQIPNGKALSRARELAALYLKAPK